MSAAQLQEVITVLASGLPILGHVIEARHEAQRLVRAALAGRKRAIEELVERLMPVIRARVKRQLALQHAEGDADDLAQNVWLTLLKDGARQLEAYDPARGASLETFVGMIAEREASNHLRAERAQKRELKPMELKESEEANTPHRDPEAATIERDLLRRLCDHLEQTLSPLDFAAFRFLYTDGVDAGEVAQIMGCSVQAIYNRQNRIRHAARAFLGSQAADRARGKAGGG